jgi:hypothetical protein
MKVMKVINLLSWMCGICFWRRGGEIHTRTKDDYLYVRSSL